MYEIHVQFFIKQNILRLAFNLKYLLTSQRRVSGL